MKQKSAGGTRPEGPRRQDGEGAVERSSTVRIGGGLGLAAKGLDGRSDGPKSYQQGRVRGAKKAERKVSKGKGKETDPGYFGNPLRSARVCVRVKRPKPTCSYEFAGAAAAEVTRIVWGTARDRRTWAGFCRYGNCDDIIDRAHLCASMFEQGEIKNPITSLQSWLNETYPETAAYLAYRARKKSGEGTRCD